MKLLVCGGRDYCDKEHVFTVLDRIHKIKGISGIISGGARGADSLAVEWAVKNEINHLVVPAKWKQHGKSAGPIRNKEMLKYSPDAVLAFPGGRGTQNMINQAKESDIPVWNGSQKNITMLL